MLYGSCRTQLEVFEAKMHDPMEEMGVLERLS